MLQIMIFAGLMFINMAAGIFTLVLGMLGLKNLISRTPNNRLVNRLKNSAVFFMILSFVSLGFVFYTQFAAGTPAIRDEKGSIIKDSIAEMRRIEINGRKQWISIRGHNKNNPVILFLAGGPGGTQMAAVRHDLKELEKYFVVVNWDQPGSGKSYYAEKVSDITPKTYIEDGYVLTNYLRETFEQQKIFLVGESWGSALGIFLIDRYPNAYHAFVGTGQMVDFKETERIDYQKAMELAKAAKDTDIIRKLEQNGIPPYYGDDVTWKSAVYINYLSAYMSSDTRIHNAGYNTFRDIFSSEYGLIDKMNYIRGIIKTFNHVYQQLYGIDLRKDYVSLKVPVYFFEGRYDINAPLSLVEEYVNTIDAPAKQIVWFEHSGHNPWINESGKFVEELKKLLPR
ncbi:alpha/beta hydrolase family protein [Oxobacter pfennigii]|uniref:prolyl aminopeptidase n=1 Tax=Oxobacter pfennigii TaxID=36849 RepID=A0A0P9ACP5_9CLOT|nr:alpha/beta hydrolase [Oxobacter pfennigii]KPU42867.1 alpha/beta hydrolase family protein [Oxobacter pfennigii]